MGYRPPLPACTFIYRSFRSKITVEVAWFNCVFINFCQSFFVAYVDFFSLTKTFFNIWNWGYITNQLLYCWTLVPPSKDLRNQFSRPKKPAWKQAFNSNLNIKINCNHQSNHRKYKNASKIKFLWLETRKQFVCGPRVSLSLRPLH